MDEYSSTGKVRFEYKFEAFVAESSLPAAEAAVCAAEQNLFWPYHDLLYANQRAYSDRELVEYANMIGLDAKQFERCLESGNHAATIAADKEEGENVGVDSTPAIYINGQRLAGSYAFEDIQSIIEQALERNSGQ